MAKYRMKHAKPPSQTWKTFFANHADQIAAVDFFTIPTINFRVLYCFIVLLHGRRKIVHFNVTTNPTAQWAAQQIIEAFPDDTSLRYLLRDRDSTYGAEFRSRVKGMHMPTPFCRRVTVDGLDIKYYRNADLILCRVENVANGVKFLFG